MAGTRTQGLGKSLFVKEVLNSNPKANPAAVNRAWEEEGMEGSISSALVNKMRAKLGLTGNLRKKRKPAAEGSVKPTYTGKKRGRKPKVQTDVTVAPTVSNAKLLTEIEADLDRLLFKVMHRGDLPEVEEAIRKTRRALYSAFTAKS
jgi:hypothetical protein